MSDLQSFSVDNLDFNDQPQIAWIKVQDAINLLWEENPKLHDIKLLVESIEKYGFQELPKFDKLLINVAGNYGAIKAGNGRVETIAYMENNGNELPRGIAKDKDTGAWVMPILIGVDAETIDIARAYAIDSNNLTMAGGDFKAADLLKMYDSKKLLSVIDNDNELPVSMSKDDVYNLRNMLDEPAEEGQPVIIGENKFNVSVGQLWELGKHRLICGDCTDAAVVERVMDGEKANLTFTSPPYWVGKEYETQKSIDEINQFITDCAIVMAKYTNEDESRIVINTGTGFTTSFDKRKKRQVLLLIDKWTNAFWDLGWNLRHIRHWLKEGQLVSIAAKSDMIDQHCEWFGVFESKEGKPMLFDDRIDSSEVEALLTFYNARGRGRGQESLGEYRNAKHWALRSYWDDIGGNANTNNHCAAFPLEVVERHAVIYSKRGEIIFEPFSGSGTTLVACERLSRRCRAVEIEPIYVSATIERWQNFTGKQAVLIE